MERDDDDEQQDLLQKKKRDTPDRCVCVCARDGMKHENGRINGNRI